VSQEGYGMRLRPVLRYGGGRFIKLYYCRIYHFDADVQETFVSVAVAIAWRHVGAVRYSLLFGRLCRSYK